MTNRFFSSICSTAEQAKYPIALLSAFTLWGNIDLWMANGMLALVKWSFIAFFQAFCIGCLTKTRWTPVSILAWIIFFIQSLLCLIGLFCFHYWGFGISGRLVAFILETNKAEASEFAVTMLHNLPDFLLSWHFIGTLVTAVILVLLAKLLDGRLLKVVSLSCLSAGFLTLLVHLAFNEAGRKDCSIILKTGVCSFRTVRQLIEFNEDKLCFNGATPYSETISSELAADNVVFVIGESSNKCHWSLYGYELPTTPRLDSIRSDLFVAHNVIPPYGSTSESLHNVLTFRNSSRNTNPWYDYANIIGLMKCAGYYTSWVSNQEKIGLRDCTGILSETADYCNYVGVIFNGDNNQLNVDEAMLPVVDSLLTHNASANFIVMHSLGSHFEYEKRYPANFNVFSSDDIPDRNRNLSTSDRQYIAEYDNSILYTDYILKSVIEMLSDTAKSSILFYLSDHSEDVYDTGNTHGHATRSDQQISIPLVFWANKKYRDDNPSLVKALADNCDQPFSSEEIIHTLLGLTRTSYSLYSDKCDLSSELFTPSDRYFEEQKYDQYNNR